MRNKYAGDCIDCRCNVGVGKGYFQRKKWGWIVRCVKCAAIRRLLQGKDLSFHQQAALKEGE